MLKHNKLSKIVSSVHDRFTYVSDIELYNVKEHWISFDDIPDGNFSGDCEDFTQAVRKELAAIGEKSRIATCGINSTRMNHAVCIYENWVIDNVHKWPMLKSDLQNYKFISISGFNAGDTWHELL
ncbi:MAG: hypothetical protein GY829_16165 [Gammaproteobacteria bacterium]|nr:hypothetical protein [Gammaproteobacteria bacterium]